MFDWFRTSPRVTDYTVTELVKEKDTVVFYRIGATDNNRVSFQMGHTEITMTKDGVNNLIRQLAVFRDQLTDDLDEQTENDAG